MKVKLLFFAGALALCSFATAATDIAAESKRANEFFDKCWDETVARHPVDESFYGIKMHYDQLEDLSDEKAAADSRHCRINSRPCIAISSWNHSMARRS